MNGLVGLLDSKTFACGVLGLLAHVLWPAEVPLEAALTLTGIFGGKEGLKAVGEGLAARAQAPKS